MVRDDNTLYSLDDLIASGIPETKVVEAREKRLLIPRVSGRQYMYVGSEVCAAMLELMPKAPSLTKEEKQKQYTNKGTAVNGFSHTRQLIRESLTKK